MTTCFIRHLRALLRKEQTEGANWGNVRPSLSLRLTEVGLAHKHHALEAHAEGGGVGCEDVDDRTVVEAACGVVKLGQGLGKLCDVGGG